LKGDAFTLGEITLKKIGEMAGVHRSTVDKVIHNRKGVSDSVRQRIKKIIKEVGYTPNIIGKALARQNKPLEIAVVLLRLDALKEIMEGVEEAYEEYKNFGLKIKYYIINNLDEAEQLNTINLLKKENISGIIIQPLNSIEIKNAIDKMVESGIPVATVNTDIPESKRLCFIGQDLIMAGRVAGKLIGEILNGHGRVAIVSTGSETLLSSSMRKKGFETLLADRYPGIEVVKTIKTKEQRMVAFKQTLFLLETVKDIDGIYITGGAVSEVAKAVKQVYKKNEIKIVSFDLYPEIVELVKQEGINFTIGQDLFGQGYKGVKLLFEYLFEGKVPETKHIKTSIDIRVKENIDPNAYI